MAKRIDRTRIDSGRFELPRKLAFLLDEKVDFESLTERDGEYSVELSVAAVRKLSKSQASLKTLKGEQRQAAKVAKDELDQEKAAHEATRDALAKAERRIKSLEKKLAAPASGDATAAGGRAKKAAKTAAKSGQAETAGPAEPVSAPETSAVS